MRRQVYSLLIGLMLVTASPLARAATEAELRAAVIYNIARFVQWPRNATGSPSFDICTVGGNPVAEALTSLEGKPLGGLPTAVRSIRRDRDLAGCHVLYVTSDEAVRMATISKLLENERAATLTISDAPNFLALGGMVQLIVIDDRQRFSINKELAEKAGLDINAKLLQLALPKD